MLKNKKGFSLVELIVVIAIMAVLVGVLAPQLMKYVEKSRKQKDESAAAEYVSAVEKALSDEAAYDEIMTAIGTGDTLTITYSPTNNEIKPDSPTFNPTASDSDAFTNEVKSIVSAFKESSKTYKGKALVITIKVPTDGSSIVVTGGLSTTTTPPAGGGGETT